MRTLLLDIETLPLGSHAHRETYGAVWRESVPEEAVRAIGPMPPPVIVQPKNVPSTWKDITKIAERAADNRAKAIAESKAASVKACEDWMAECWDWFRAGSLGSSSHVRGKCADGRVHTIALTTGEGVSAKMASHPDQERDLLLWLLDEIKGRQPKVLGSFAPYDFRFLGYRALTHGLDELARYVLHRHYRVDAIFRLYGKRPDIIDVRDLADITHGKGLDAVSRALGIDHGLENPIAGAEVMDAYMDGREDEIVAHCRADVRDLEAVYRRLAPIHGIPYTPHSAPMPLAPTGEEDPPWQHPFREG